MEHPSDAMIRAFLDGEARGAEAEIRAHLSVCAGCRSLAHEQVRREAVLAEALSLVDVLPPMERARAEIRRRERAPGRWAGLVRRNLPRVASIAVLLTAGAAAALPGSPIRTWLTREWAERSGSGDSAAVTTLTSEEPASDAETGEVERVGATIPYTPEGIELRVSGLSPEASLTVLLVQGAEAGIFSAEGTRFRSQSGRLEAEAPPGDVTVEIPVASPGVRLVVNGEVYLRKTGEVLEILGPVSTRTQTEIRFSSSRDGANAPASGG